jgi:hypothetical protein
VAWSVLTLGGVSTASAQPARSVEASPAQPARASLRVFVDFVAIEQPEELDAKIASWFASQPASYASGRLERLDADRLLGVETEGVHVFVTEVEPRLYRIYFAYREGAARRFLVRDISLPSGLDEVGMENAAQVIFSASLALSEGREDTPAASVSATLGASVPEASTLPAPSPAPPKVEPTPRRERPPAALADSPKPAQKKKRWYLVTNLGYAARYRGPEGFAHGPQLGVGVARRAGPLRELGIRVSGTLLLPITLHEQGIDLELRGVSSTIEPWIELGPLGELRLLASLGAGVEFVSAEPSAGDPSRVAAARGSTTVDPFALARLGVYTRLGRVSLGVAIDLTFQAVLRHYDIIDAGQTRPEFEAWRAQPGLSIQALWSQGP